MVQLALPKNSQVRKGRHYAGARRAPSKVKTFKVYRYDPETGREPALGHL